MSIIVRTTRKLEAGMVDQAIKDFHLDAPASYGVGDQAIDMELAKPFGARGIVIYERLAPLAQTDRAEVPIVAGLRDAARWMLSHEKQRAELEANQ